MEEKKAGVGSIVATILIIAVIVLGALYFWGKRMEESKATQELLNENNNDIETVLNVSSEDDLNSIEAELNSTNLEVGSEF